jgi:ABC-2 type transport system permease protein
MLIGYGIYAKPAVWIYPLWLVLSLFVPLIPMLAAAFLGFLIARVSAGFRKTNTIQTVITMAFVIFCFFLRFILQDMFQNGKVEETLEQAAAMTENTAGVYLPARWFAEAVTEGSISSALLLAGTSLLLFGALFAVVGKSYGRINSAMKSHAASGKYKMTGQKQRSVLNAIAFKEFRRMTGSTIYVTNAGLGFVLAPIMGILTLVIGADRIVAMVTANAPFEYSIIQPAIPFIVYFFIGMVASTACSPALEGKNYWIVQSLPITKKTLYQGKMLFNMYLAVPAMAFSTLCICISAKVPAVNTLLYLMLGFALCSFSTTWGCVCGVSHMRLDWENEVEVIKQGTAVLLYMLPNMFIVMGLVVGVVLLGLRIDHRLIAAGFTLIVGFLALLSYLKVMSLARKEDGPQ